MWKSDKWKEYELLDTSDGERLERWGNCTLVRPDPQVVWNCLLYTSFAAGEFLYRIILKKGKIDFMKVCPNCQNQVNDDVAFCPICGTQFGNQQNTQNRCV